MTMISSDLTIDRPAKRGKPAGSATRSATSPAADTGAGSGAANRSYVAWGKRAFDLSLVLATAPLWLPLVMLAAALVFAGDHKWPFYVQVRLGRGRKAFRMLKLRTMVVDADRKLEALLDSDPVARAEWDATQKLKKDPRITLVGAVLRKTSLDELPQLFNVLRGDMSLVGPRPIMLSQQALYPGECYYQMRPGLTGLWQVSERNEVEFVDRVRFDNVYLATQSLRTDMGVLFRTVGAVTRATGY